MTVQADAVQSCVITKQPKSLQGLDLRRGEEKGRGHPFIIHDEGWQETLWTEKEHWCS